MNKSNSAAGAVRIAENQPNTSALRVQIKIYAVEIFVTLTLIIDPDPRLT